MRLKYRNLSSSCSSQFAKHLLNTLYNLVVYMVSILRTVKSNLKKDLNSHIFSGCFLQFVLIPRVFILDTKPELYGGEVRSSEGRSFE